MREVAGWLLVGLGLFAGYLVFVLCMRGTVLTPWPLALFGIFVFRGGIHLLKVAIAARVCLEAQERLYPSPDLRQRPAASGIRRREHG
jgi:hypothetical protein